MDTGVTGWGNGMAKAWMPGAERIDGGLVRTVNGVGAPRVVWTVTGTDPTVWSARGEARRLIHQGGATHLVWNPVSGKVAQSLAATRRAGIVLGGASTGGHHLDHGDEGRVCVVVAVVATEREPFTDGPMVGLFALLEWLDSWGVPRTWPAGSPGFGSMGSEQARRTWSRGGHFGHDQVPGSTSTAPGHIRPERVLAGFSDVAKKQEVGALSGDSSASDEHPEWKPSVMT